MRLTDLWANVRRLTPRQVVKELFNTLVSLIVAGGLLWWLRGEPPLWWMLALTALTLFVWKLVIKPN